ncbi:hypothetical protein TGAM01_v201717, partial [Trichoderma gamsii]
EISHARRPPLPSRDKPAENCQIGLTGQGSSWNKPCPVVSDLTRCNKNIIRPGTRS